MSPMRVCILLIVCLVGLIEPRNVSFVNNSEQRYRILAVFGHPGWSHFKVFQPLLIELAKRGHDLTVLSHFPRSEESKKREPLPTYKDISVVSESVGVFVNVVDLKDIKSTHFGAFFHSMGMILNMACSACEAVLLNPRVIELVRSEEKFDLLITESFNTDCFLSFAHRFNVPYIGISSHHIMPMNSARMNNPDNPSYIPHLFTGFGPSLTFFQRLWNAVTLHAVTLYYDIIISSNDQAIAEKTFGPLPPLKEIGKKQVALLLNGHNALFGARPHLPNVVEVGGLHIPKKVDPLPEDIARFVDSAKEGVLYFNLGSMVKTSSMPKHMYQMILRVIADLPCKVLWKWENDDDRKDLPRNLMKKKWLPQFDVFNHPNVKCYMGHGGLLGLSEAIYVGMPMILMPLFGDQHYNAAQAKWNNVSIVMGIGDFNEKSFRHAIDECFNNTRYRESAEKLSKAYRDRPANPLETAVWWVEYVARGNGVRYLRSAAADLSWPQFLLLDVALFLVVVSLLVAYFIYRVLAILASTLAAVMYKKTKKRVNDTANSKKRN